MKRDYGTRDALILSFVAKSPESTNSEIAVGTGVAKHYVTNRTALLCERGKLSRTVIGRTLSNIPIYGHSIASETTAPPQPKKKEERKKHSNVTPKQQLLSLDKIVGDFVENLTGVVVQAVLQQLAPRIEAELQRALPAALPAISAPVEREYAQDITLHTDTDQSDTPLGIVLSGMDYDEVSAPVPHVPEAKLVTQGSKQRLPKIGVIGIGPQKRQAVAKEFEGVFNIVFWWSEEKDSTLRSMAHQCEVVFVLDYVAHRHVEILLSRGANVRRVRGDIRQLTDDITAYYLKT